MAEVERRREGVTGEDTDDSEVQDDSADSSLYMNKSRMSPWCSLPFAVGLAASAARLLGLAPVGLRRHSGTLRATPSLAWACLGYAIAVLYDTYVVVALKVAVTSDSNYKARDLLINLNGTIHMLIVNIALVGALGRSRFTVASLHLVDKIRRYMHDDRNSVAKSQWKEWKIYTLLYLIASILYFCVRMFDFIGSQEIDIYDVVALKDAVTSDSNYKARDILKILHITIQMLIVNVALVGAHGRSRFTVASLHLVDKIRRYMHDDRNSVAKSQWKEWKIYTLLYLIASILYFCVRMYEFIGSQKIDVSRHLSWAIVYLMFVPILEIQLLWVAMTVNNIFVDVNKKLEVVVCKIENDPSTVSAEDVNAIARLSMSWTAGRDLAYRMGLQHGALLAVLMCHRVFHLMFTSYSIVFALLSTDGLVQNQNCAYFVLCLVSIVLMIHPGHVIEEEMEVMCELAVRGEVVAEAGLARAQLRTLCRQLEAARAVGPVVAPLGLFVLDRPLLVKILGGIVTYLVILLQIN